MMSEYHDDLWCGSCGGPLESYWDAICETCWQTAAYWLRVIELQKAINAATEEVKQ
jgi:hypothetical protein